MNISVEREASFEVSQQRKIKRNDAEDVIYDISNGVLTKTSRATAKVVDLSVESQASLEVSQQMTNMNDVLGDSITESPIAQKAEQSATKPNGAKVVSEGSISPTKVMDFHDGSSGAPFSTPTSTKDSRNLSDSFDPWGDDSRESVQSEFTPFDQPSGYSGGDDETGSPNKVLFPDDQDSKEYSLTTEENVSNDTTSSIVDENGFPTATSSSGVYSAGSVIFDELKEAANDKKEEPSRWKRLIAKIPEGTRVKAMQVQRQLLSCHKPSSVVIFEDGVDPSSVGNTSSKIDPSIFSYKSFQEFSTSMISTSQEMLSLASDAPTPIRTQSKGKPKENSSKPTEDSVKSSIFPSLTFSDDKSSNHALKLCIDLYEESAFQTLMSKLEGNTQVKEVHVFRSWDEEKQERTRTIEDIRLLFKTIGSLSNLHTLNLANFLVEDVHLVSLSQWKKQNLKTIRIHLCKGALSKHLLAILARLPALRDLTLEMNSSFPFHILLRSQTLESLTIVANGYQIDNLHAMEMVQEIPKNETLKKLTIEPPLRLRTFKLLASALGKNISIEELKFALLPGNDADTTRVMDELARTLMNNASLRSIRNLNYSRIEVEDDRTCDALMKALSENYIIEDFLVFEEEPWFRDRKNRILKENKMEYDSMFPQVFKCGNADDVGTTTNAPVSTDDATYVSAGLATISDSVKSQAQRVASGALDFVGQSVGLKRN